MWTKGEAMLITQSTNQKTNNWRTLQIESIYPVISSVSDPGKNITDPEPT